MCLQIIDTPTKGHANVQTFNQCSYLGQRQDPKSTVLCKMVKVQLRSVKGKRQGKRVSEKLLMG